MRLERGGGLLPLPDPLDLPATLHSGQAFRWRWRGLWAHAPLGDLPVAVRVEGSALRFRCPPGREEEAARLLHGYFRLEDDLPAVQGALRRDPALARAVDAFPGLRLIRQGTWPALLAFLLSPASNIPRLERHLEDLARTFGRPAGLDLEGERLVRFTLPTPADLAEAGEARLRRLGLGWRARWVAETARRAAEGTVDLAALDALPTEAARRGLTALPGVGEKVAECVLLYGLGRTDAFPVDLWVRRALLECYFPGQRRTDAALTRWGRQRWGPLAGWAQLYLYHARRTRGPLC